MRRRKVSRWNRKNSGSMDDAAKRAARARASAGVSAFGATSLDSTDYGLFYDKINARGLCDDLVLLEDVSNEGIVEVLRNRYLSGDMYTSIGPVLIAVNPYKQLEKGGKGIYTAGVADYYHRKGGGDFMAPHIYRIAAESYKNLCADSRDQCVIVTGESGAGKTEAAKQLMQFVTTVGTSNDAQKVTMEGVQKHLLESNPILEAFGNAQTIRNDNSSRFGKYMELQFTYKGVIRGGKVTNYLLEKSRVTGQAHGERCFHVLHYLLQGASPKEQRDYRLLPASDYEYLMRQERHIPGIDDGKEFVKLKASMSGVDIQETHQSDLFSLLGGVLAAGNMVFQDHGDGNRATVVKTADDAHARTAACFGVDADALETALTTVTLVVGRRVDDSGSGDGSGPLRRNASSWITNNTGKSTMSVNHMRNLNGGDASKSRDALAKEVYKRVFLWIVEKVNRSIECTANGLTMGILDIYGFEIFDSNGFEQFCINYVNEKLQQYFIDHTIRAEQEDYETEGVEWEHVDYFNNKTVCDMIEGRHGLLSLLDEVSSYKDNDGAVLVNRYNRAMGTHDHYFPGQEAVYGTGYARRKTAGATTRVSAGLNDKHTLDVNNIFGVRHFAGNVTYKAEHFIEKNADRLHRDLVSLLSKSSNPLAAKLFEDAPTANEKTRRHPSLSAQFKKQVEALCGSLARCRPHYVRCIKPNSLKAPLAMDIEMTTHQVKYLGLQENVRVRRQGYAFRMPFEHFVRRYSFVSESTWPDRKLRKCWPDGTPYDPAHPIPPTYLIKFDEVVEEFEELRDVNPGYTSSQSTSTDSSDEGMTDKEARTPPRTRSMGSGMEKAAHPGNLHGRTTPAKVLKNFTPARLIQRQPGLRASYKAATAMVSATVSGSAPAPAPSSGTSVTANGAASTTVVPPSSKQLVAVTSTRIRRVERKVPVVESSVWHATKLNEREAIVALLEEGKPKRWDKRLTGGMPMHLKLSRLKADSGDIKMGKTKIFIKNPHTLFDLEDQRAVALFPVAVLLQSKARSYICRRRYVRFLAVVDRVGALARGYLARARYRRILYGVMLVQAAFRGKIARSRYARLRVTAKGRPLRYYALKIQRLYRGFACRKQLPPRILRRARHLGPKLMIQSQRFRSAATFQAVCRMYAARKAFLRRRRQTTIVQSLWRRYFARKDFYRLREGDALRTLKKLKDGMPLVKHTVGSNLGFTKLRPTTFMLSEDEKLLTWKGFGARGDKGINVVTGVERVTKGLTSNTLRRTGDRTKGEGDTMDERLSPGGGHYLVLHEHSGRTLDIECVDYSQRDSICRAFSKLRGEW